MENRTQHATGFCVFCGEAPLVQIHRDNAGNLLPNFLGCCLDAREVSPVDAYGRSYEEIFGDWLPEGVPVSVEHSIEGAIPVIRFGN